MLTYNLNNTGSDSLYEYLYKCIKKDIIQGKLKPGDKLPSKRTFAKNLGISVITIENAYSQLIAEGYIYSLPKKGYYVSDLNNNSIQTKPATKEQVVLTSGDNSYVADFSSNQTEHSIFPFSIWAKVMRDVINDNQT